MYITFLILLRGGVPIVMRIFVKGGGGTDYMLVSYLHVSNVPQSVTTYYKSHIMDDDEQWSKGLISAVST